MTHKVERTTLLDPEPISSIGNRHLGIGGMKYSQCEMIEQVLPKIDWYYHQ